MSCTCNLLHVHVHVHVHCTVCTSSCKYTRSKTTICATVAARPFSRETDCSRFRPSATRKLDWSAVDQKFIRSCQSTTYMYVWWWGVCGIEAKLKSCNSTRGDSFAAVQTDWKSLDDKQRKAEIAGDSSSSPVCLLDDSDSRPGYYTAESERQLAPPSSSKKNASSGLSSASCGTWLLLVFCDYSDCSVLIITYYFWSRHHCSCTSCVHCVLIMWENTDKLIVRKWGWVGGPR